LEVRGHLFVDGVDGRGEGVGLVGQTVTVAVEFGELGGVGLRGVEAASRARARYSTQADRKMRLTGRSVVRARFLISASRLTGTKNVTLRPVMGSGRLGVVLRVVPLRKCSPISAAFVKGY
jgi:hypothetical protein